jgi:hypothetical protein
MNYYNEKLTLINLNSRYSGCPMNVLLLDVGTACLCQNIGLVERHFFVLGPR